jgi:hypothetical protein
VRSGRRSCTRTGEREEEGGKKKGREEEKTNGRWMRCSHNPRRMDWCVGFCKHHPASTIVVHPDLNGGATYYSFPEKDEGGEREMHRRVAVPGGGKREGGVGSEPSQRDPVFLLDTYYCTQTAALPLLPRALNTSPPNDNLTTLFVTRTKGELNPRGLDRHRRDRPQTRTAQLTSIAQNGQREKETKQNGRDLQPSPDAHGGVSSGTRSSRSLFPFQFFMCPKPTNEHSPVWMDG